MQSKPKLFKIFIAVLLPLPIPPVIAIFIITPYIMRDFKYFYATRNSILIVTISLFCGKPIFTAANRNGKRNRKTYRPLHFLSKNFFNLRRLAFLTIDYKLVVHL